MADDRKLSSITQALQIAGIDVLVMGGHAVRYYGIDRNTNDFDLVTAVAGPEELRLRLPAIPELTGIRAEPVWRRCDFARFEIGRLPDGREEWLEFWIRNHLLDDFESLKSRAEIGNYGAASISFLSIADLIRSKETERESDWKDIALLEEIQDARNLARMTDILPILTKLRSRRGMDRAVERGLLDDHDNLVRAIGSCSHNATAAFLLPRAPEVEPQGLRVPIEPSLIASLRSVEFGSARHFTLVEVCRRGYRRHAVERDRADKQAKLAEG